MTVLGHIHQGVVILDDAVVLPEGATVEVRSLPTKSADSPQTAPLSKYAGIVKDLPANALETVDQGVFRPLPLENYR